MKWFGPRYGAPYEHEAPHIPVPVGQQCGRCGEPITSNDSGLVIPLFGDPDQSEAFYHYECHLRSMVGGLNHQLGKCLCCGGTVPPDPPEMTRREAAKAAVQHWQRSRGQ
jgi:hypothetical protein